MNQTLTTRPDVWQRRASAACMAALFVMLFAGAAQRTFADPDMFHEMALIREAMRIGHLPTQDPFAYTPTIEKVVHHEWGTGAVLYFTSSWFGAGGVLVLRYMLMAFIAIGVVTVARRRGAGLPMLAIALPLVMTPSWMGFTTIRAQVFTLAFLVAMLWCLELDRRGRRWWIAPWLLLYVIWVNLHAGFIVGVLLFALELVERVLRRQSVVHLVPVWVAMVALVIVNPYGWDYIPYLWHAIRMDRPMIGEWLPVWRAPLLATALYFLSILIVVYAFARRAAEGPLLRILDRLPGLLLLAAAAWEATWHQRHVTIYAVLWVAFVPAWLSATPLAAIVRRFFLDRPRLIIAIAGIVFVISATALLIARPWYLHVRGTPDDGEGLIYPVGAVGYLEEHEFAGNVMTPFGVGAFVSWRLYPEVRVSMDGRYEVAYQHEVFDDHVTLYNAHEGWRDVLEKYARGEDPNSRTDLILIPLDRDIGEAFTEDPPPGWRLTYQDDAFLLYAREDSPPAAGLPVVDRRGEVLEGRFP